MIGEYRRSLKMPEAEELFDLAFYRPFAFLFVKGIYRTPLTPNMVTMISMIFGVWAGIEFSTGSGSSIQWAAGLYAIANILDCADGQLARLQGSGTLFGRVIDGIADYISSIAIFLGIGWGLSGGGSSAWLLVMAAGLSSGLHAMFFDKYQSQFISSVRGERNFLEREMEQFNAELARARASGGNPVKVLVLNAYLRYLGAQQRSSTTMGESVLPDPTEYRKNNLLMIRAWSLLGPTTNRTLLIVCAFFLRLDIYLWTVLLAGNIWLIICFLIQRRIHGRSNPTAH